MTAEQEPANPRPEFRVMKIDIENVGMIDEIRSHTNTHNSNLILRSALFLMRSIVLAAEQGRKVTISDPDGGHPTVFTSEALIEGFDIKLGEDAAETASAVEELFSPNSQQSEGLGLE